MIALFKEPCNVCAGGCRLVGHSEICGLGAPAIHSALPGRRGLPDRAAYGHLLLGSGAAATNTQFSHHAGSSRLAYLRVLHLKAHSATKVAVCGPRETSDVVHSMPNNKLELHCIALVPDVLPAVCRGQRREQSMASRTISSGSAAGWRAWRTSGGIWCRRWKLWGDMAGLCSCLLASSGFGHSYSKHCNPYFTGACALVEQFWGVLLEPRV